MFELGHDQAQGLRQWSLPAPTRVLPLVQMSGWPSSLALLHALQAGFTALGHEVATVEGVQDLRPEDVRSGHAALLRRWLGGVPPGTVVLLHAPLEALAVLLADSLARPVLPMATDRHSTVAAYNAVKVLVQVGGLQPLVLQPLAMAPAQRERAAQALVGTCRRQFGLVPVVWGLAYDEAGDRMDADASEACLLKLLDSALTLDDVPPRPQDDPSPEHRQSPTEPLAGVSDVHGQRHA